MQIGPGLRRRGLDREVDRANADDWNRIPKHIRDDSVKRRVHIAKPRAILGDTMRLWVSPTITQPGGGGNTHCTVELLEVTHEGQGSEGYPLFWEAGAIAGHTPRDDFVVQWT